MLFKNNEPILVNVSDEYDVYIGRGRCPKTGKPGIWGNPYSTKENSIATYKVKTLKEAIDNYREYLINNEFLINELKNLEGKRIGCWCKQKHTHIGEYFCHGQIIIEEFRNRVVF